MDSDQQKPSETLSTVIPLSWMGEEGGWTDREEDEREAPPYQNAV